MSRSGIDSGLSTSSSGNCESVRCLYLRLQTVFQEYNVVSLFVALLFVFLFFYVVLARWLTARLPNTLLLFFNWKIPTPLCALPAHSASNLRFQCFWFIFIFLEFHNFSAFDDETIGMESSQYPSWAVLGRFLIEIFKLNEKRLQTLNEIKRDFN